MSSDVRKLYILPMLLVAGLMLNGCGSARHQMPVPQSQTASQGMVEDLSSFPQDLTVYARNVTGLLLDTEAQQQQWKRCQRLFYSPWKATKTSIKAKDAFAVLSHGGYAENLLPRSARNREDLIANASQDTYPNLLEKGIVIRSTDLRAAPSMRPCFDNPRKAGEGYPFDLWQYARLPIGMPVLITHMSDDGVWVFVENALVGGWVKEEHLAVVDEYFMQTYQEYSLAAILEDDVPLMSSSGRVMAQAGIGTLLPENHGHLLIPVKDALGNAQICEVKAAGRFRLAPVPLTAQAVAELGNRIMNQPYGWGGMYGNRDCSGMLRDIFLPFGLWLPRNSKAQAKAWTYVDLSTLSLQDRERYVLKKGKPFATLLWLPGHITLYIGEYKGRAAMFHDMWGIRTERNGVEGRHIVGRAVVTSTQPGIELPAVQDRRGLLARIRAMSILE